MGSFINCISVDDRADWVRFPALPQEVNMRDWEEYRGSPSYNKYYIEDEERGLYVDADIRWDDVSCEYDTYVGIRYKKPPYNFNGKRMKSFRCDTIFPRDYDSNEELVQALKHWCDAKFKEIKDKL